MSATAGSVTAGTGPRARGRRPGAARGLGVSLLLLIVLAAPASALDVPALSGRVNDHANLLSKAVRDRIESKLAEAETRTGAQVAVLTVPSLEGDAIEDFAVRVFQAWRLGRRGLDDGVLLVVAHQDRRMRIEVGYGLEGRLTDALSRQILDDRLRPRFRAGDFPGGIEAGVDAIVATIEGAPLPPPPRQPWNKERVVGLLAMGAIFTLVIGTFSLVALATPGAAGWFLYVFLIPFYATFPTAMFPPYGGVVAAGSWIVLCPLVKLWLRTASGKKFRERSRVLRHMTQAAGAGGGGGGRWSSGGSSGGGGGFSGGGGSSGGGGASSSW